MRVALICTDKPRHLEVRKSNRDAHLGHLKAHENVVEMAGPLIDPDGQMYGSLIILDVETMDQAERFAAEDPYAKAGLFSDVRIEHWNKVIG